VHPSVPVAVHDLTGRKLVFILDACFEQAGFVVPMAVVPSDFVKRDHTLSSFLHFQNYFAQGCDRVRLLHLVSEVCVTPRCKAAVEELVDMTSGNFQSSFSWVLLIKVQIF
jgi:hypothetical protein